MIPVEAQAAVLVLARSLEQRIAALEERLNKNSTNSSKPPSSDPPSVKRRPPTPPSGKKRGGQPGHLRRVRALVPPEQVRHVIQCKPPHCRKCGHELQGNDPEPLCHQVAELPPVSPAVDEYQLHRLICPDCGTSTCAALPPGVPKGAFGPRLRAILSVLAGAYRLGKRPIRQLVSDLLGLSISIGMIARLERQSAAELEVPVTEICEHVRAAASAHIDETSWWQGRPGRPGGLLSRGSHRSRRADYPHRARHLMTSLPARSVGIALTRVRSQCTCRVSNKRFMRRHPLPSPGSLRLVPLGQQYYGTLRLPAALLAALRFLRLAIPSLRPLFVPPGPGRRAVDQSGVGGRYLRPPCSMETAGSPKFPGESL